jgi:hypothetical protein
MPIPVELPKPLNDEDFDRMSVEVYKVVLGDPTPAKNGRRGQAQEGTDSYIFSAAEGRVGVQSKRYNDGGLTEKDIKEDVAKADAGETAIVRLHFATTAPADAKLTRFVNNLSDERAAQGLFRVMIDFWPEIVGHIRRNPSLQEKFEPTAPGAVFHRIESAQAESEARAEQRHQEVLELLRKTQDLNAKGGQDKAPVVEAEDPPLPLPAKFVTTRSGLLYLTLDQLAISLVERQLNTYFERRVTVRTEDGELFLDALRQDDNLPADLLLEVRWIRKRYLDAPTWTEQIVAKVKLYELMTGRKASGILTLVVPNKLGTIDELLMTKAALAAADRPIKLVIATYAALGFDPGAVSAAVFASNTQWGATKIEVDPLR